eukprot:scaffold221131_cov31-Tisochrysis_lutea.AAC.1
MTTSLMMFECCPGKSHLYRRKPGCSKASDLARARAMCGGDHAGGNRAEPFRRLRLKSCSHRGTNSWPAKQGLQRLQACLERSSVGARRQPIEGPKRLGGRMGVILRERCDVTCSLVEVARGRRGFDGELNRIGIRLALSCFPFIAPFGNRAHVGGPRLGRSAEAQLYALDLPRSGHRCAFSASPCVTSCRRGHPLWRDNTSHVRVSIKRRPAMLSPIIGSACASGSRCLAGSIVQTLIERHADGRTGSGADGGAVLLL